MGPLLCQSSFGFDMKFITDVPLPQPGLAARDYKQKTRLRTQIKIKKQKLTDCTLLFAKITQH